jgi:hypothetical protein
MSDLPPFAELADKSAWSSLDADSVYESIAEASQMIRDDVPLVGGLNVDERIAAGSLSLDTVRSVVVAMVDRVVSVPGYVRQRSVTVDDATQSFTYDSSVSGGEMFITEREMQRLMGRSARRQRAFTITLGPGATWT